MNYDPIDKTVLANEQVDDKGCSWRSGAKVEKKLLKQWFFKITEFREELLQDLDLLARDGRWPERVLTMQKHWIGKKAGTRIKFAITSTKNSASMTDLEVFTTRPDTIYGVQYLALASNHPVVQGLAKTNAGLQEFLNSMPTLPLDSKAGYLLSELHAMNPLSSEDASPAITKELLPVYVAPYVLSDYGDGAVMGVPAHDERDYQFWKFNCPNNPIRSVIEPLEADIPYTVPYLHYGKLTSECGQISGWTTEKASIYLIDLLKSKGIGSSAETWRLRDWLISRQRYWGTPIPIIHCEACGPVPVPISQLPVELPNVSDHWTKGVSGNPLELADEWVNTSCPKCHGPAKRDTDTMDTFVDSSWYFMRFIDVHNSEEMFSPAIAQKMLPVDLYIGGVEHAILHLLYARFISKFLARSEAQSPRHWPTQNSGEPFKRVLAQGMVHGKTHSDPVTGRFLKPIEVDMSNPSQPVILSSGLQPSISFEKMSKSKYNGVDPTTCMTKYGADATRAHILFQAPVSEVLEWDEAKISGVTRWMKRVHGVLKSRDKNWRNLNGLFQDKKFRHLPTRDHITRDWRKIKEAENPEMESDYHHKYEKNSQQNITEIQEESEKYDQFFQRQSQLDKDLWRQVQQTIERVTKSYGETASLNTVVSDLMSLTKLLIEHTAHISALRIHGGGRRDRIGSFLICWHGWKALVQMMAPITPAFAEECWVQLHCGFTAHIESNTFAPEMKAETPATVATQQKLSGLPSIFEFPFPKVDGSLNVLGIAMKPCSVQVNGKLKFAIKIDFPTELEGVALEKWIIDHISQHETAREKLTGLLDISRVKKVIVVQGGRTVNLVIPKST